MRLSPLLHASGRRFALAPLILLALLICIAAYGTTAADGGVSTDKSIQTLLLDLTDSAFEKKKAAIEVLARTGDPRLVPFLEDYNKGNVYLWRDRIVVATESRTDATGGKRLRLLDPLARTPIAENGQPFLVPNADAKPIEPSRRERVLIRDALTLLRLSDPNPEQRLNAIIKSGDSGADANLPVLRILLQRETNRRIRHAIEESIAILELNTSGDSTEARQTRLKAAEKLGDFGSLRSSSKLKELLAAEKDPSAIAIYSSALERIDRWQNISLWIGYAFSGLSLGSILILMALGLSIIFGLMGVINMAHGELMMVGAYATYFTQQFFVAHFSPAAFNWYFVAAIPISFAIAAGVGMLIEALVIRHLYGRPLETLLATWGVGLVLIQATRLKYGDNIGVNSPTWLQGGFEIASDITLPYNRLFIIAFCIACIGLMYFITSKTKLGLLLRATTQNRGMAACLGVPTRRIDLYTFGLGAGLAGMAGCALTLIGGVTPDMGQNYIVDSFMVVVTGGVGKLAGAIWAGLGLGILNKLFEPLVQSVWAKVLILICVVLFIQWRPSGLFPAKGRSADV